MEQSYPDNPGPVIVGNVFGCPPWWYQWRLPISVNCFLKKWYRPTLSVELLWHPVTHDHIAVVNGIPLQLPHPESEYPRFIGLDFRSARIARRLYRRVRVDLTGYQTVMSHGKTGMRINIHPE